MGIVEILLMGYAVCRIQGKVVERNVTGHAQQATLWSSYLFVLKGYRRIVQIVSILKL